MNHFTQGRNSQVLGMGVAGGYGQYQSGHNMQNYNLLGANDYDQEDQGPPIYQALPKDFMKGNMVYRLAQIDKTSLNMTPSKGYKFLSPSKINK